MVLAHLIQAAEQVPRILLSVFQILPVRGQNCLFLYFFVQLGAFCAKRSEISQGNVPQKVVRLAL